MPEKRSSFPVRRGKTTFGMHLMLDAYDVPLRRLNDMRRIYRFLYNFPEKINMTRLTNPFVVDADESSSGHDPGGISGVVLINESHISIHTFGKRGFFTLDIYSCSNFENEVEKAMLYIKKHFPYKKYELKVVERGANYPVNNRI